MGRQAKAEAHRQRFNGGWTGIQRKLMDEGRRENSKTNFLPLRLTLLYDEINESRVTIRANIFLQDKYSVSLQGWGKQRWDMINTKFKNNV